MTSKIRIERSGTSIILVIPPPPKGAARYIGFDDTRRIGISPRLARKLRDDITQLLEELGK